MSIDQARMASLVISLAQLNDRRLKLSHEMAILHAMRGKLTVKGSTEVNSRVRRRSLPGEGFELHDARSADFPAGNEARIDPAYHYYCRARHRWPARGRGRGRFRGQLLLCRVPSRSLPTEAVSFPRGGFSRNFCRHPRIISLDAYPPAPRPCMVVESRPAGDPLIGGFFRWSP
jgi:hypothetical protein